MEAPEWKKFEEAVGAFLQSLDPDAKVSPDVRTPDKDTGLPRQRDVWIETSYGGHLPITILVSCKRQAARVDQQDVDAFIGEFGSSRANVGVLYSYSGFTEPAIAKAISHSISCCTLYEDRAPDVPEVLFLRAFCSTEEFQLLVGGNPGDRLTTMNDLFALRADPSAERSILDDLLAEYDQKRASVIASASLRSALTTWEAQRTYVNDVFADIVALGLVAHWKHYEAKIEAYRVDGSYSFTAKNFKGTFATPAIERYGNPPGDGWRPIETLPPLSGMRLHAILHTPDIRASVERMFGAASPSTLFSASIQASTPHGEAA
ncbi:MAG: restriction endonuclease [Hyphomonadaceae bacterium]